VQEYCAENGHDDDGYDYQMKGWTRDNTNTSICQLGVEHAEETISLLDVSGITTFDNVFYTNDWWQEVVPSLSNWNVTAGTSFYSMFVGYTKLGCAELDDWDVSSGTNFKQMFRECTFTTDNDLSKWDVSSGTDFGYMFQRATSFTSDLSNWNVSSGTDFDYMFTGATSFDSDLSKWDVSSGTYFGVMFKDATSFDSDLSKWDVSSGTSFSYMFAGATALNVSWHANPSHVPCWAEYDGDTWQVNTENITCTAECIGGFYPASDVPNTYTVSTCANEPWLYINGERSPTLHMTPGEVYTFVSTTDLTFVGGDVSVANRSDGSRAYTISGATFYGASNMTGGTLVLVAPCDGAACAVAPTDKANDNKGAAIVGGILGAGAVIAVIGGILYMRSKPTLKKPGVAREKVSLLL